MEESTLLIYQDRSDIPETTSGIVLSELIHDFDDDDLNEIYNNVESADVSHKYDVPVYDIAANHVWEAVDLHDSSPQRMELLIPLYRQLAEHVTEDTDKIRCVGVSGRYLDTVRDLARNENLELEVSETRAESVTTRSIAVRSVKWLLISVFDAFVSLLLRPFYSVTDADTLVKYPVFRANTFRPIENCIEMDFDSVFTLLTVSRFLHVGSVVDEKTTVMPIRCFSTVASMMKSYQFCLLLIYDLIVTNRTEAEIVDAVEAETGLRLDNTVGQLSRRAVWSNFPAYLYYRAACQLYNRGNYRSVLITSNGPSGKALSVSAVEHDIEVYCLPHAIINQLGKNTPSYTGVFTEGTITERIIEHTPTRYIHTGFPKHINLYNKRGSIPSTDSTKTLLVATQAYADVPEEFIRNLVPAVLDRTEWRVIIKTHPQEKLSKYRQHLSETEITESDNSRLLITNSDLHSWIGRSQLLLTINSNVGIESVILGTPAVSYNPWSPEIRDPIYAKHGSVPTLRDPSAVVSLLDSFDSTEERSRQEAMLEEQYMVRNNSIPEIASRIRTELSGSTTATPTEE